MLLTKEFVKTDRIENRTTDDNYFVLQTDGSFFQCFCHATGNNRGATEIVSLLFVLFTPHG